MSNFPRSTIDRPWLERYKYYQEQNDLLPFWYGSEWVDLPLEEGTGGEITINVGDDFWMWDIHFDAQGGLIEAEQAIFPIVITPGLEFRVRIDGNLAWGSWIDNTAPSIARSEVINDYGEGWILERGSHVTIEWRRVATQPADEFEGQRGQWVIGGAKLPPRGATRLQAGWRNQTMEDWCKEAVLSPYRYGVRVQKSPGNDAEIFGAALSHANMHLRTRDRDFILERIGWIQYATEIGIEQTGQPYIGNGFPFAVQVQVQDIPWHNPAPQGIHGTAFSKLRISDLPDSSRELRIPRLIPANSLIEMEVGFSQFAMDPIFIPSFGDYAVIIAGHEIVGDNRSRLKR